MSSHTHGEVAAKPPGKVLPLNSKRLTKVHIQSIAHGPGEPVTGSREELQVVVSGKLQEDRDPTNVQVRLCESEEGDVNTLHLIDQGEGFAEIDLYEGETAIVSSNDYSTGSEGDNSREKGEDAGEVEKLKI